MPSQGQTEPVSTLGLAFTDSQTYTRAEQRNVINTCIYSRPSTLPFTIKVRLDIILEKVYAIATFVLDIPKVVHCGPFPQTWFALYLYHLYLLPRPRLLIVKGSSTSPLRSLCGYFVESFLLHPAYLPMADIKSLLNPLPDQPAPRRYVPTGLTLRTYSRDLSPPPTPRKKPKLSKDAAIFIRGDIRGTLNYPPYEDRDGLLLAQHQQHEVYPMGNIADFPRHIPYNSEKKSFLEKTGRESFEGEFHGIMLEPRPANILSLPIRVQVARRGEGVLHDVGLQYWTGSDDCVVQVHWILQGLKHEANRPYRGLK